MLINIYKMLHDLFLYFILYERQVKIYNFIRKDFISLFTLYHINI